MNFSKTTEYALRIVSFMATDEKKLHTAKDIYESLRIPFRYLRKLLTNLTKSGLITSVQGKMGGYYIAKDLRDITLLDVVHAAGDHQLNSTCFFGFQDCILQKKCAMHDQWDAVRRRIQMILASTSMADIKESGSFVL